MGAGYRLFFFDFFFGGGGRRSTGVGARSGGGVVTGVNSADGIELRGALARAFGASSISGSTPVDPVAPVAGSALSGGVGRISIARR